jgi:hypothetical protein
LGGQILTLNGFVNSYSQVKWIFSTKMAQHKALILFKLNSHAKTAPDSAPLRRVGDKAGRDHSRQAGSCSEAKARRERAKCEGRKSLAETNPEAVALAKALSRKRPKGGKMSLGRASAPTHIP